MNGQVRTRTAPGKVLIVEIDAPHSRNSLTLPMLHRLGDVLTGAGEHGAVVVRGAGQTFCAGVDGRDILRTLQDGWSPAFTELVDASKRVLDLLIECPVPVIAAVDGYAVGAGFTYAMLADLRIATPQARFRAGHIGAGAPLDGGSSYALTWLLGPARSMAVLLEDRSITSAELHRWGLAMEPVDRADLEDRAIGIAAKSAAYDRESVRSARVLLRHAAGASFQEQWAAELAQLRRAIESGRLQANLGRLWPRGSAAG